MKNMFLMIPVLAFTAACQMDGNQSAATGAAAGAALGAAVNDDNRVEGALLGGVAGAVAGTLVGQANTAGDCVYRDQYGRQYVAKCP